ncbi:uncharacterized protein LOC116612334 [Nematostella vectensis]|uniref:uncharacterized protein LOC116612334 n=1 Tax=Nematostella vectensis TaxID=45351 RepID=UPI0020775CB4|nr:uncharacterized protein LOC116612334 [Nematostella vectensis]
MSESLVTGAPVVDHFLSDHAVVRFRLGLPRPGLLVNTINYRKLKSIDLEQLKAEMLQSPLCTKDSPSTANELDIYVKEYNNTLAKLLNRHAPNKTRTRVTRPVVPWYNDEIDQAKRARRKAERKWRKSKLPSDLADFKKKRNHVTNAMNKATDEYYTQFVAENSSDQKKLFDAASKLLGGNTGLRFPEHANKTVLANDIGRYFVRKINTIRADIDATSLSSQDVELVPPDRPWSSENRTLTHFNTLSESDVNDLMSGSAKKTCILDPMPICLVYDSLEVLLPAITNMVNSSLSTGHFPADWKEAAVTPLLKKGTKDTGNNNVRPVSNLQFTSKITERAVFNQLYAHVTENVLLPELQSAYRKSYSTETTLL